MRRILSIIFAAWALTAWVSCTGDGAAMRQRLAYVSQCNRDDTLFTEAWLPTVDSLVSYFDRHGNANERMMAHYLQGRVHHDMGEAPIALECYQKATEVADTSSKGCDYKTLAGCYSQSARLFHQAALYQNEISTAYNASKYYLSAGDTLNSALCKELSFAAYYLTNQKDKAEMVLRKAREQYVNCGHRNKAATTILGLIYLCLKDSLRTSEAKSLMDAFESESGLLDANGDLPPHQYQYYGYKGWYYEQTGQVDSAEYYFRKTLQGEMGLSPFVIAYHGLLDVYKTKKDADSIAKYSELYCKYNDSTFLNRNTEEIARMTALYNYDHHQRIAEINARKASQNNLAAIFIAILGIISIIVVYKRAKNQFMRKLAKLSQDYESAFCNLSIAKDKLRLLNYDYETNNHRLEAEINKLRQSIDKAHNEKKELGKDMDVIQCKLNDLLDENNELRKQHKVERKKREREIARLQEQVKSLEERLRMEDVLATESRFKSTVIYKKFMVRGQSRHVLFPPTEKDWEGLTEAIRLHFVRYYSLITHQHSLPTNQYRLCLLIRLGVSNEQLRILLDKDTQQIYRLKKLANQALFNCQDASTLEDNLRRYFE